MPAVQFDHVSKRFTLQHERARTFQEVALNLLRGKRPSSGKEEFWALRDVSFSLERGRTLGIIGRNGSGKSTMLKLLSGTMRPTGGSITANGRVFGLLELAAGFHPDLSGRDNVFLNGTFLGLSHQEMVARLDQIVAFAELERFIDTPVKHYSSGMYMRLGFAIAISLDPDILVIDEVLAVGDAAFRQKCFVALADLKARHKTILFVTHDPSAVRRFCDDALWLDQGLVRSIGPADEVLRTYLAETATTKGDPLAVPARPGDPLATPRGLVELLSVETVRADGQPSRHFESRQPVGVRVRLHADALVEHVAVGVAVHRADGLYLNGTSTGATGFAGRVAPGEGEATCWLGKLPLSAAEYTVSAAVWVDGQPVHRLSEAAKFAIRPPRKEQAGILTLQPTWTAQGALALHRVEQLDEGVLTPATAGTGMVTTVSVAEPIGMAGANGKAGANGATSTILPAVSGIPGLAGFPATPTLPVVGSGALVGADGDESDGGRFRPGRPEDQVQADDAFRFRWRPVPTRLAMGEGDDEFLGPGWYPPENWPPRIRWTSRVATLYLQQDEWTSNVGVTMCRPQHGPEVVTGRILVGGKVAGEFQLASPSLEPFTFPVEPAKAPQEVEVRLEVELPQPAQALGGERSDDQRVLGVAVREVWLE